MYVCPQCPVQSRSLKIFTDEVLPGDEWGKEDRGATQDQVVRETFLLLGKWKAQERQPFMCPVPVSVPPPGAAISWRCQACWVGMLRSKGRPP